MTHAESGTLLSYLDGQLTGPEASVVEVHLAACESCRGTLDEVRSLVSEVSGALNLIQSEAPTAEAHARFRSQHASMASELRQEPGRPWRFATSGLLKAAAIVLLLAGAAAAAIPGSPVRRWAASVLDRLTGPDTPAPVEAPIAEPDPAAEPAEQVPGSAVYLVVQNGRARVSIQSPDPSARIVVRLIEGVDATIQPMDGSDIVRYVSGEGFLEVHGVQAGVAIEIPSSLPFAVVEVDGRVYWEKDGSDVRVSEPVVEESTGEYVFRGRS